ncbi:MAG: HlyD family efflux transporter periplasmic adaptor subunit [Marinilabiliaceae bacterium]|nr:HlyD family efflux transporter periplasmic adaptor subunit [Marinilabiliaceae bacterium]
MIRYYFILLILSVLTACQSGDGESDAYGNFEAIETFVSSEVTGKALQLNVEEGQVLKTGTLVCLVDTVPIVIKRDQLEASRLAAISKLGQVSASLEVLKAQNEVLQKDYQRITKMLKDGAATQKQFDDVEGQLTVLDRQADSHQAQMNSIRAEVKVVEAQLAGVWDQLRRCRVQMPVDGTILQKYSEAGEMIMAGKPILKVANLETIYLGAYVTGKQLPAIQLNQKVQVIFDKDEATDQSMEGTISWISSSAEFTPKIIQTKEERVDQVYAIKVLVKNDGRLKIGMPGEIKF